MTGVIHGANTENRGVFKPPRVTVCNMHLKEHRDRLTVTAAPQHRTTDRKSLVKDEFGEQSDAATVAGMADENM
jgi:hypothetical protein